MYITQLEYFLRALRENNHLTPSGSLAISTLLTAAESQNVPTMIERSSVMSQYSTIDSFMAKRSDLPGVLEMYATIVSTLDELTLEAIKYHNRVLPLNPLSEGSLHDRKLVQSTIVQYFLRERMDREKTALEALMAPIIRSAGDAPEEYNRIPNLVTISSMNRRYFHFLFSQRSRVDYDNINYSRGGRSFRSFLGDYGFQFPVPGKDPETGEELSKDFLSLTKEEKLRLLIITLKANKESIEKSLALLSGIRKEEGFSLISHIMMDRSYENYLNSILAIIGYH